MRLRDSKGRFVKVQAVAGGLGTGLTAGFTEAGGTAGFTGTGGTFTGAGGTAGFTGAGETAGFTGAGETAGFTGAGGAGFTGAGTAAKGTTDLTIKIPGFWIMLIWSIFVFILSPWLIKLVNPICHLFKLLGFINQTQI